MAEATNSLSVITKMSLLPFWGRVFLWESSTHLPDHTMSQSRVQQNYK